MKKMSSPGKRFGCNPGCFVAIVVGIVIAGIGGYFVLQPVREGKLVESRINERFATAPEYVPAADGGVAPERLAAFIRIRSRLLQDTGHVQERMREIEEFNAIEDESEISAGEGFSFLRKAFGALPMMLTWVTARNDALLAEEMGLGEYMYIYVLAYGPQVCPAGDCRLVKGRTTRELAQILRNQHEALQATGGDDELAAALLAEIDLLESGRRALPWLDGLPTAAEASLEPRRTELDALYCAETAEMDLTQKNR